MSPLLRSFSASISRLAPMIAVVAAVLAMTVSAASAQTCSDAPTVENIQLCTNNTSVQTFGSSSVTFIVTNNSIEADVPGFSCTTSGAVASCSIPGFITVPAHGSQTITVTFTAGSTAGSGGVAVFGYGLADLTPTVTVTVTQPITYGVTVTPKNLNVTAIGVATNTQNFTVQNTGNQTDTFTITAPPCVGTATNCTLTTASSVTLGPSATATATVSYTASTLGSTSWVKLAAASAHARDTGSVWETVGYKVVVTPDNQTITTAPGGAATQQFTVQNTRPISTQYQLTATCGATETACSAPATVTVNASSSAPVTVSYTAGGDHTTGSVKLLAKMATDVANKDTGWVVASNVTMAQSAPSVDIASVNPGNVVDRELCLKISVAAAAAWECGDLRIAHAIPAVRTMDEMRPMSLVYQSQAAHPYPSIQANVTMADSTIVPDTVAMTVSLNGTPTTVKWLGSNFARGTSRRLAAAIDGGSLTTGVYAYTVTVTHIYNSSHSSISSLPSTGTLLVVNRSQSPMGAGWWLGGVEQLVFPSADTTTRLWIGGDGSARLYSKVASGVWAGPKVNRPDTLKWDGTNYVRYLMHGARVYFDASGKHVKTLNRLGHATVFAYSGSLLSTIQVPTPTGSPAVTYTLNYTSGTLSSITSPGPSASTPTRTTTVTVSGGHITTIRDPNGTQVSFGYGADPLIITSRTNRVNATTYFTYDAARHFSKDSLPISSSPAQAIVVRYRFSDSLAIAGTPVRPESAYVKMDGPRSDADVRDYTFFWLDRNGSVTAITDALGRTTTTTRGDLNWPALITRIQSPNGRVFSATYSSARGTVLTQTDSSTYRDSSGVRKYATTQYSWDSVWDFVTQITSPEGRLWSAAYDSIGRRTYQQAGANPAARATFAYYASSSAYPNMVRSIKTPLSTGRDSVEYDSNLGDLKTLRTPLGFKTRHFTDRAGKDTLVSSPIDSTRQDSSYQRTLYDLSDFDTLEVTFGPPQVVDAFRSTDALTLTVRTVRDAEGLAATVTRSVSPDLRKIGSLTTTWLRDPAGRVVRVTPPGVVRGGVLRSDSTVFDLAGNAVKTISRRGIAVTMKYDALNRLTQRIVPGFTTTSADTGKLAGYLMHFPRGGIATYPADTETYGYDAGGNLDTAYNTAARITRTFNQNGTLASDSTRVRTWHGPPFNYTTHVYGLRYGYDLEGRVVWMKHPSAIAPRLPHSTTPQDSLARTYDIVTGQLASVTDELGNAFTFAYDLEGKLDSTTSAGGTTDKRHYDDDGRLLYRVERLAGFTSGSHGDTLHSEGLQRDARGKILVASTAGDTSTMKYDGLGQLARSQTSNTDNPNAAYEDWRVDALGHAYWTVPAWNKNLLAMRAYHFFIAGTEQDTTIQDTANARSVNPTYDHDRYDSAGNRFSHYHVGLNTTLQALTYSYHRGDDKLVLADTRVCFTPQGTVGCEPGVAPLNSAGSFEQYGYDALGRRVLTSTFRDTTADCQAPRLHGDLTCISALTLTVWSGNQVLYEIRDPLSDATENDTLTAGSAYAAPYGRIAYTYGAALDRPVDLVRMGYTVGFDTVPDMFKLLVVIPHKDWRDRYDGGTIGTQLTSSGNFCAQVGQPPTQVCLTIDWPVKNATTYGYFASTVLSNWFGSEITSQLDGSGNLYRRNRYYDAFQGRFTQEDPIGLAGGLNAYGFAEGDPISYSDPFGLCPVTAQDPTPCPNGESGAAMAEAFAQIGHMAPAINHEVIWFLPKNLAYAAGGIAIEAVGSAVVGTIVTKGGPLATRVIGSFPKYIELSESMGAKYFQVSKKLWDALEKIKDLGGEDVQEWLNHAFLDKAIAEGVEFRYAGGRKALDVLSWAGREVRYLLQHGYEWSEDGMSLVPPK